MTSLKAFEDLQKRKTKLREDSRRRKTAFFAKNLKTLSALMLSFARSVFINSTIACEFSVISCYAPALLSASHPLHLILLSVNFLTYSFYICINLLLFCYFFHLWTPVSNACLLNSNTLSFHAMVCRTPSVFEASDCYNVTLCC